MDRHGSPADPEERIARLCHDLRQYTSASLNLAEMPVSPDEDVAQRLRLIAEQQKLANELMNAELRGARRQTRSVDLLELVDQCVQTARFAREASVTVKAGQATAAFGDPVQMRQAIANVLDNAARAAGRSGAVDVTVDSQDGLAWVQIADDGQGFGNLGPGMGQGLSIVQQAIRANDGRLEILSGPGPGTTVRLFWPQHPDK